MSARILIVDDTPLNVKLLSAKLAHDYYIVSTAENGVEALKKVAEERPDLILLDVMMPEMDGFETCRRLKADPKTIDIPVVMITALTDVTDRVKGLEAGADDFLAKPINDLALMARMRSLLRTKILMDEWRLREATALQLSPLSVNALFNPLDVHSGHLLIIDDEVGDTAFIRESLGSLCSYITSAPTISGAEPALADHSYDIVICNLGLKKEDALTICSRLRTNPATRQIPILFIADPNEMDRVAKGLDLGANDYLMRPLDRQEVYARTRTQLRHKRNYDRLRNGLEQNLMMALIDPLTGAFNRRYLEAHLPRFLQHAADNKRPLCVQMIDIDHFKQVNDTYGHAAGDYVLQEVARRISTSVRPSDLFVRMGGEEFAVIMPGINRLSAQRVAERLRLKIAETPFSTDGSLPKLTVTVSIGLAETLPDQESDPGKVFERADAGLMQAKQSGRNKIVTD